MKNKYIVILDNQDYFTTSPSHANIEVTPAMLWEILWHMICYSIASWMNPRLENYKVSFYTAKIKYLDARCGCTSLCECEAGTELGMMSEETVNAFYEESPEDRYMGGATLVVDKFGILHLNVYREYNPAPYESNPIFFTDLLRSVQMRMVKHD